MGPEELPPKLRSPVPGSPVRNGIPVIGECEQLDAPPPAKSRCDCITRVRGPRLVQRSVRVPGISGKTDTAGVEDEPIGRHGREVLSVTVTAQHEPGADSADSS